MGRKGWINLKNFNMLIRSVEYHRNKIRILHDQIRQKIESLKAKHSYLIRNGEYESAENYAREIRLLNILSDIVYNFELGLLAVEERLDTIKIILQALEGFKPTAKAINDALSAVYYIPGNFNMLLESLAESYIELVETIKPPAANIVINLDNPEAEQIITQVEREVGKLVSSKFPEVPAGVSIIKSGKKVEELITALATDGGFKGSIIPFKTGKTKRSFEDKVHYYFKHISRGKLDIYGCARYLGVSPQRVIEALYLLAEEGKIKFNN